MNKLVTVERLKEVGACPKQIRLFKKTFGDGRKKWTQNNIDKAHKAGLDVLTAIELLGFTGWVFERSNNGGPGTRIYFRDGYLRQWYPTDKKEWGDLTFLPREGRQDNG